jgi:hypothetical protein
VPAQDVFKIMLKEHVIPVLGGAGFKGRDPTWRLWSPQGDCVVVNLQKSSGTTKQEVKFYVNLSVVPVPWWEFWRDVRPPAKPLAMPGEVDGMIRRRLYPPEDDPGFRSGMWWGWCVSDEQSAQHCGQVLTSLLTIVVPELQGLLDREQLITLLRSGYQPNDWMNPNPTLYAGFLAADDPERHQDDLDAALASLRAEPSDSPFYETSKELSAWLQQRAAAKRSHGG